MSSPDLDIRLARPDDSERLLEIYAPAILGSAVSFETRVPALDEFRNRIVDHLKRWPWLAACLGQVPCGFAYAGAHRQRSAYQWSVEVSVYVDAAHRRNGVARRLYDSLFEVLRAQHYRNAYAGITLPNPASIALHERLGFQHIGTYPNIGYKLERWHDVGWWGRSLQPHADHPPSPVPLPELLERGGPATLRP